MSEKPTSRIKSLLGISSTSLNKSVDSNKIENSSQPYIDSVAQKKTTITDYVKCAYENFQSTDVKGAFTKIQKETGNLINNASGKDITDAADELRETQKRYNDVLATKLCEALTEINQLKKRITILEGKNDCR